MDGSDSFGQSSNHRVFRNLPLAQRFDKIPSLCFFWFVQKAR